MWYYEYKRVFKCYFQKGKIFKCLKTECLYALFTIVECLLMSIVSFCQIALDVVSDVLVLCILDNYVACIFLIDCTNVRLYL